MSQFRCPECKEDLTELVLQRCEQEGGVSAKTHALRTKEKREVIVTCSCELAYHFTCP